MHAPPRTLLSLILLLASCTVGSRSLPAQDAADAAPTTAEHGAQYQRLLIRDVLVIDGNGTPVTGPKNVIVEGDRIAQVGGAARGDFDAVIEGQGRYLMPGLISMHSHLQDERAGIAMPFQYQFNLWLASGITTIRDVGCDRDKGKRLRAQSAAGEIIAPRIFLYMTAGGGTAEEARQAVRAIHEQGGDGIKIFGMEVAPMKALLDEAHSFGLRVAHHAAVAEANAWQDIEFGTTSIEHWYGIPDAAIPYGSQHFPAHYNYSDELDRFRWAGRLFKEADPQRLGEVLQGMVDHGVAWDPTLNIYEAARDLERAQNQSQFADYLHPALEKFFQPNLRSHGSFFLDWTTEDEIEWKHNYQIWFAALREFAERGGTICVGEDAGFIYRMYGFGLIRELELQQEAGFHPLDVIAHATGNNARVLGQADQLGRVKAGYRADLVLVNGNPLRNLKYLYPTGVQEVRDGTLVTAGRAEWTLKDGRCYHGPTLMREVADMVATARAETH